MSRDEILGQLVRQRADARRGLTELQGEATIYANALMAVLSNVNLLRNQSSAAISALPDDTWMEVEKALGGYPSVEQLRSFFSRVQRLAQEAETADAELRRQGGEY